MANTQRRARASPIAAASATAGDAAKGARMRGGLILNVNIDVHLFCGLMW
jgi:hypothetical protein